MTETETQKANQSLEEQMKELLNNENTFKYQGDERQNGGLYGWICPVCGRGISPFQSVCPCCNNNVHYETITCDGSGIKPQIYNGTVTSTADAWTTYNVNGDVKKPLFS